MSEHEPLPCPFVYANGKRCKGHVRRVRAYGRAGRNGLIRPEKVRKYRFWCTEKDDHAGMPGGGYEGKIRMEFYPDQVPTEYLDAFLSGRIVVEGLDIR